jgi:hypothetical protein
MIARELERRWTRIIPAFLRDSFFAISSATTERNGLADEIF